MTRHTLHPTDRAVRSPGRLRVAVVCVALACASLQQVSAQPAEDSVRGAELYLNRKFGKVPLEQVSEDILKEFNMTPASPVEKVPDSVLKEFNVAAPLPPPAPVAPLPVPQGVAAAQAVVPNIYGVPEGEVAIEAAIEANAAFGPGVMFSLIQPGWIEKGDVSRVELRAGPGDTHARLYYDVPSDTMGAQWMSLVLDYSMVTPAFNVDTAPRYRSNVMGLNWMKPVSSEMFGDWLAYWGVRLESRSVETTDPSLGSFYAKYGGRASYIVPNVGLSRVKRQSQHALSEGKSESINFETSMVGSGANYWKFDYKRDQFWELDERLTLNLYGSMGYAKTWTNGVYPLAQRFLATGRDAVRGFSPGTIGPTDTSGNPIGGLRRLVGSGEIYLQAGSLLDEPLYVSAFADTARLDRSGTGVDAPRTYTGYGLGLTWRAPSGLVKFNFAKPANPQPGDRTQTFLFEFKTMLR